MYDYLQRLDGLRRIHGDDVGSWKDVYQAQRMSRVRVSVHTQLAKRITRSARLSFSSQVANLGQINISVSIMVKKQRCVNLVSGGIIGLFTGMSILSLAESLFWVVRLIKHIFVKEEDVN